MTPFLTNSQLGGTLYLCDGQLDIEAGYKQTGHPTSTVKYLITHWATISPDIQALRARGHQHDRRRRGTSRLATSRRTSRLATTLHIYYGGSPTTSRLSTRGGPTASRQTGDSASSIYLVKSGSWLPDFYVAKLWLLSSLCLGQRQAPSASDGAV